jgi:23S rRNA-/tRNA-specific pseudouridylate synthase
MSAAGTLGARDHDRQAASPPNKKQRRAEEEEQGDVARAAAAAAAAAATAIDANANATHHHRPRPPNNKTMATCPACGNGAKPENMMRHLRSCCPDHLNSPEAAPLAARADEEAAGRSAAASADAEDSPSQIPEALRELLDVVAQQEAVQRRRVLKITFMVEEREREQQEKGPGAATTPAPSRRRPLPDVAQLMALPERRAARLLERAMRTIEMPRDPAPDLKVLHECARFLAVAKPAGVPTTPAHRWKGGSMVNRLLWYGEQQRQAAPFEPRVLHRLDLDTSGVLLCAKDARAAAAGQAALAGKAGNGNSGGHAEKTYVALAYGWPPPWMDSADGSLPPGVTIVTKGADNDGLLAFDVDAAIGRHPDSAVGRRVAEDGKPSFAQAGVAAEEEGEREEEDGSGRRRKGGRRGGGKEEEGEDEGDQQPLLPASTRFVVLAAAEEPPPGADVLFPSSSGPDDDDPTKPAPLACGASRAATLATFGERSGRRRCCLVLASLRTGRTHQIRLHLAHAGLPLAGDELYGCALRPLLGRQALHAWRLKVEAEVLPPQEGKKRTAGEATSASPAVVRLDLKAPLPDDIVRAARALGVPIPATLS